MKGERKYLVDALDFDHPTFAGCPNPYPVMARSRSAARMSSILAACEAGYYDGKVRAALPRFKARLAPVEVPHD